jgi:hypothetical protein
MMTPVNRVKRKSRRISAFTRQPCRDFTTARLPVRHFRRTSPPELRRLPKREKARKDQRFLCARRGQTPRGRGEHKRDRLTAATYGRAARGSRPPDTAMLPSSADLTDNTVASDKPTACGETTVEDTDAVGCLSGAHGLPPRGPAPSTPVLERTDDFGGGARENKKKFREN